MINESTISLGPHRSLGGRNPTWIVAEIGQNHNGRIDLAEQLIDAAAWAGVDAVKFTKRDLSCDLSREAHAAPYPAPHAFGKTYGEHRQALELAPVDYMRLKARAERHGLTFFATACDVPSARLLLALEVPVIKIASRDLSNLPLLHYVADHGRPVFISTGMSSLEEVDSAVAILRRAKTPFVVLQCTSLYPTPWEHAHLRSIWTLASRYGVPVGFSDHTPGVFLPPIAVGMGACVIEKHLTLDRSMKGSDHCCSLEPDEMLELVEAIRRTEQALGSEAKPVVPGVEEVRRKLGRSLVLKVPVPKGTPLTESMLTLKCPGDGLGWTELARVVGRRAARDIEADEKLSLEDLGD